MIATFLGHFFLKETLFPPSSSLSGVGEDGSSCRGELPDVGERRVKRTASTEGKPSEKPV
jgi:hypothetical protein